MTHDVTKWHSPQDGHHHGFFPRGSELAKYYLAAAGQEIGYPWLSSPNENLFPFPAGKHEGFTFLHEEDTHNDQSQNDLGSNFISAYLMMVHTLGDANAARVRIHSHYGVFRVTDGKGNTGLVCTGGHMDAGVLHLPYKQKVIQLPSDPPNWPYDTQKAFGLPYRAYLREDNDNVQFWNSQGQGSAKQFPERPNHILQLAWKQLDCWSRPDENDPTNPAADHYHCKDGSCDFNGSLFQVNAINLIHLPTERPFNGFTDVHGHVVKNDYSGIKVPLIITEGVPQGDAVLSRGFNRPGCEDAPCLEFDDGTVLYAPGYMP
jgi:hypothetical protein